MPKIHVVFERRETTGGFAALGPRVRVLAGVWLDLEQLDRLILKAAKNKSRRARSGALGVEVHKSQVLLD